MIRKNELDVDFIGGERSLTEEELGAISEYIKTEKAKSKKAIAAPKKRVVKRTRATA